MATPEQFFAHYSIPAFDAGSGPIIERGVGILSNKWAFPAGCILFSKLNPRIPRAWFVDDAQEHPRICSTEFLPLLPRIGLISPHFLQHLLYASIFQSQLRGRTSAATKSRERLNPTEVMALEIPLPPLAEQERIARRLTEQLAHAEYARAAAHARIAAAESLPAAYMREVFEGPEASAWPKRSIEDFAETCSGATPSRAIAHYFGGGIPWVKTGELDDGVVCTDGSTEETVTRAALSECSLPLLPIGTLLIAMYGQGQTRGRTGLLACEATTNQACFAIRPSPEVFDSEFLQLWFRANYIRLRRMTENRGGNQPNLNGVLLRRLEVPLPLPLDQRRIAADLSARLAAADHLATGLRAELAAALLRSAFSVQRIAETVKVAAQDARIPSNNNPADPFRRSAIGCYIVHRFAAKPEFGRVFLEKNLYLTEAFVEFDMAGCYKRMAAGPLDAEALEEIESTAAARGFFTKHPRDGNGWCYRPGPMIAEGVRAAGELMGEHKSRMDRMLDLVAGMNTDAIEMTVTLFAAWNDRMISGAMVTDALLIVDVREHWHESKRRFTPAQLSITLNQMRSTGLVPRGIGPRTQLVTDDPRPTQLLLGLGSRRQPPEE